MTGRPGAKDRSSVAITNDGIGHLDRAKCENDRVNLSELRNEQRFISIMQGANRANVSFYPVGPGGFSDSYRSLTSGPGRVLGMMADITDGYAIIHPAELESGLRRIVADGARTIWWAITRTQARWKVHKITVRVSGPGFQGARGVVTLRSSY